MKKINFRTFFMLTLKFFSIVHKYMYAIPRQDKEIPRNLIKKLGLFFNFRGGYDTKKINSRTFFTASLKFLVLHINLYIKYALNLSKSIFPRLSDIEVIFFLIRFNF